MNGSRTDGSIVALDSGRPDLLVFEVRARISESAIEWMAATVDAAFERQNEIDMLVVMRNFEGAELGAVFDKEALRVQLKSVRKVRRYGVVGAPAWARAMIESLDLVMPVDARTFDLEQEAEARRWVDEGARASSST